MRRLEHACGFRHPALLRSVDSAHHGTLLGACWRWTNGWSAGARTERSVLGAGSGDPLSGGDPDAHRGGVGGMLALDDGWSAGGGRGDPFLEPVGRSAARAATPRASERGRGVLALDDRLVSWGRTARSGSGAGRAIRCRAATQAHRGAVRGVLALDDRLVSWGKDGTIRFWSRWGDPLPGGDPARIGTGSGACWPGRPAGQLGRGRGDPVSSGSGDPLPGGDPEAHGATVRGVLALDDRLVSWGGTGRSGCEPGVKSCSHRPLAASQ